MQYKRIGQVVRPRRGRRIVRGALAALVCVLAVTKLIDLVNPPPRVGYWRSAEARSGYHAAYHEVMATLPPPDTARHVATRFGTVHVIGWHANTGGEPILLLPGHSSGAMMWAENLASWIGRRPVYALDPLGDAGLSAQSLPITSLEDETAWISDVVRELVPGKVHVVGHSFGGATAAMFALHHPDQVASLSLIEPVLVIRPLPASVYFWTAILALPTPQSWKDHALAWIGGTTVAEVREATPMSRMVDEASSGYATAMPIPATLTDEEWRSVPMPVRLDLGETSRLSDGQQAAVRIRQLLPAATVTVWPGRGHSLPMEEREALGDALLGFWSA